MSEAGQLLLDRDGGVALVRLDRPDRRNALGSAVVAELAATLQRLDEDADTGAIVLSAAPPGFCAGSDLKELAGRTAAGMVEEEEAVAALTRSIVGMRTAVVGAVEGFAIGGGCMLAVACDVVVTGSSCRWHLSEVSLGWFPPWGLAPLISRVGVATARRLVLGTRAVDGAEAARLGIADVVVADGEAEQSAGALATELAALPRAAVASTKEFFAEQLNCAALDRRASALFARDLASGEARTSLARYGVVADLASPQR